jgi:hypothetical protein
MMTIFIFGPFTVPNSTLAPEMEQGSKRLPFGLTCLILARATFQLSLLFSDLYLTNLS